MIEAERLLEAGDPDGAMQLCAAALNENPDDTHALFVLARCNSAASRFGIAANINRRVTELSPLSSHAWNNLGHSYHSIGDLSRAEEYTRKAIQLDPSNGKAYNNLTAILAARVRYKEAIETSKYALFFAEDESDRHHVKESVSLSYLGSGEFGIGWDYYESGLPSKYRRERTYRNEERWDGSPGGKIVCYGEQGIGDEIMFASIIPDVMEDADVIIECDRRLEGLFRRSFPGAEVHGTRFDKAVSWPRDNIRARCAFGSLGRFYRRDALSFPRQPYLTACPLRRKMYCALLDSLPGKKIGLAWTGGTKTTRMKDRSISIEAVENFVARHPEVSFVSLEYKDTGSPKGVHNFPFITRTNDYDDTAALVAELDGVISVTTAVALLAGALGTECHVLVPQEPTWHWGYEGEMPWFPLKLYRGELDLNGVGTAYLRPPLEIAAQ